MFFIVLLIFNIQFRETMIRDKTKIFHILTDILI